MDDRRARRRRCGRCRGYPLPIGATAAPRRSEARGRTLPRRLCRCGRQRRAPHAGRVHALRRGADPVPRVGRPIAGAVGGRSRRRARHSLDGRTGRARPCPAVQPGDPGPRRAARTDSPRRLGAPGPASASAALQPDADPALRRCRELRPGGPGRRARRNPARRLPADRRGQGGSAALPQADRQARS